MSSVSCTEHVLSQLLAEQEEAVKESLLGRIYEDCRFSLPPLEIMVATINLVWENFGSEDFSRAEFREVLGETVHHTSGKRLASLQYLLDAGYLTVYSRGRFQLSEEIIRELV